MRKLINKFFIVGLVLLYLSTTPKILAVSPTPTPASIIYDATNPDINLSVRGSKNLENPKKELIDFNHETDANAPQLGYLIEGNPQLKVFSVGQLNGIGAPPSDAPKDYEYATVVGFATTAGQNVLVPLSGYNVGDGTQVMVQYADTNNLTLNYTRSGDPNYGYTLYLSNLYVNPQVIAAYKLAIQNGRSQLPALPAGFIVGTTKADEIKVSIKDTGSFLDPRWKNDWWIQSPDKVPFPPTNQKSAAEIKKDFDDCVKEKRGEPMSQSDAYKACEYIKLENIQLLDLIPAGMENSGQGVTGYRLFPDESEVGCPQVEGHSPGMSTSGSPIYRKADGTVQSQMRNDAGLNFDKNVKGSNCGQSKSDPIMLKEVAPYSLTENPKCKVVEWMGEVQMNYVGNAEFRIPFAEEIADHWAGTFDAEHMSEAKMNQLLAQANPTINPYDSQSTVAEKEKLAMRAQATIQQKEGVLKKLLPETDQDKLKCSFIRYVAQKGSKSAYAKFKIDGKSLLSIPCPPEINNPNMELADYNTVPAQVRKNWRDKWGNTWAKMGLFPNEKSTGRLYFAVCEDKNYYLDIGYPEVFRMGLAANELYKIFTPVDETTAANNMVSGQPTAVQKLYLNPAYKNLQFPLNKNMSLAYAQPEQTEIAVEQKNPVSDNSIGFQAIKNNLHNANRILAGELKNRKIVNLEKLTGLIKSLWPKVQTAFAQTVKNIIPIKGHKLLAQGCVPLQAEVYIVSKNPFVYGIRITRTPCAPNKAFKDVLVEPPHYVGNDREAKDYEVLRKKDGLPVSPNTIPQLGPNATFESNWQFADHFMPQVTSEEELKKWEWNIKADSSGYGGYIPFVYSTKCVDDCLASANDTLRNCIAFNRSEGLSQGDANKACIEYNNTNRGATCQNLCSSTSQLAHNSCDSTTQCCVTGECVFSRPRASQMSPSDTTFADYNKNHVLIGVQFPGGKLTPDPVKLIWKIPDYTPGQWPLPGGCIVEIVKGYTNENGDTMGQRAKACKNDGDCTNAGGTCDLNKGLCGEIKCTYEHNRVVDTFNSVPFLASAWNQAAGGPNDLTGGFLNIFKPATGITGTGATNPCGCTTDQNIVFNSDGSFNNTPGSSSVYYSFNQGFGFNTGLDFGTSKVTVTQVSPKVGNPSRILFYRIGGLCNANKWVSQQVLNPNTGLSNPFYPYTGGPQAACDLAAFGIGKLRDDIKPLELCDWERPQNMTGRSFHFALSGYSPRFESTFNDYIQKAKDMGGNYLLMYPGDVNQAVFAAEKSWSKGIIPLIRPNALIDTGHPDWAGYASKIKEKGIPAFIQIYNEPGDDREYESKNSNIGLFAQKWLQAAIEVTNAGGHPGLQIQDPADLDAIMQLAPKGDPIWKQVWFSWHGYAAENVPPDHMPKTADEKAFLSFVKWNEVFKEKLGFEIPIIGTEGGWEIKPPVGCSSNCVPDAAEIQKVQGYLEQAYKIIDSGVLPNGQPVPKSLWAFNPTFIMTNWGNGNEKFSAFAWFEGMFSQQWAPIVDYMTQTANQTLEQPLDCKPTNTGGGGGGSRPSSDNAPMMD